jgi:hypothetical protein
MFKEDLLTLIEDTKAAGKTEEVRQALAQEALCLTAGDFLEQLDIMACSPEGTFWGDDVDATFTPAGQAIADKHVANDWAMLEKTIEELIAFLESRILDDNDWLGVLAGVQAELTIRCL